MAEEKWVDDIDKEIINAIQCKNCERDLSDTKLYQCSYKKCSKKDEIYCKTCGNMGHMKIEGHTWNKTKKEITKNGANLALVKQGQMNLNMMVSNVNFSDWKEKGLQVVASVGGTAAAAANAYQSILHAGNAAKVNGQLIDLVVDVTEGVKHGSKALKDGLQKACPWAIVAAATFDIIVHSYRFWKGDIEDWKEFGWYCTRSVTAAAASGLSGWGGSSLGSAIGTAICPGVGTVAGAIIGGMIASIIGGTFTSKVFDCVWQNPNEKKREQFVREAVSFFHFRLEDIYDSKRQAFIQNKFNKKLIMKQYRQFAKMYHPDRPSGNLTKWNQMQMYLGLLLALIEKNPTEKNEAVKCMKSIGM